MAKKVVTILIDDLTGEESEEVKSHSFSYDGKTYSIDLGPASADKLDAALAPFIDKAVISTTARRSATAGRSSSNSKDLGAIREWAHANGYSVGPRGRIAGDIVAAFEAAH